MITLVPKSKYKLWKSRLSQTSLDYCKSNLHFQGVDLSKPASQLNGIVSIPDGNGSTAHFAAFDDDEWNKNNLISIDVFSGMFSKLQKGCVYSFDLFDESHALPTSLPLPPKLANKLALSWSIWAYSFRRFKKVTDVSNASPPSSPASPARIVWPNGVDQPHVLTISRAFTLFRDLVDSPALSLGPAELADVAVSIGKELGADSISVIAGEAALRDAKLGQIAAVGMGSSEQRQPRLVDLTWVHKPQSNGATAEPAVAPLEVVLVGKGITFDTGGLSIKTNAGMRFMKKDMAGAAQVCESRDMHVQYCIVFYLYCIMHFQYLLTVNSLNIGPRSGHAVTVIPGTRECSSAASNR